MCVILPERHRGQYGIAEGKINRLTGNTRALYLRMVFRTIIPSGCGALPSSGMWHPWTWPWSCLPCTAAFIATWFTGTNIGRLSAKNCPFWPVHFPPFGKTRGQLCGSLSMGGYGAFKLALSCPEKFAAAASLSGALDIAERFGNPKSKELPQDIRLVFGSRSKIAGSRHDLFYLAKKLSNKKARFPGSTNAAAPKIFCTGATSAQETIFNR